MVRPAPIPLPDTPCRLEQAVRAQDVGRDERVGPLDRPVDVTLRREVDDPRDAPGGEDLRDQFGVPDVAPDELEPVDPLQAPRVPCVGQRVQDHDPIIRSVRRPPPDQVDSDEACSTSDEYVRHGAFPSCSAGGSPASNPTSFQSSSGFQESQQVSTVAVVREPESDPFQVGIRDPSLPPCDLLRARDGQSLAILDGLDEGPRLLERFE